jgi:TetR/AcrR family transcriptional regulator
MASPKSKGKRNLTRQRILVAGARVFNRRGYHGATLHEIAHTLGVTKPALYYYVKTKEELAYQCHCLSLDIGLEGIKQAVTRATSPDEQLRMALSYYIEGMADQLRANVVLLEEGTLSLRYRREIITRRDEYEGKLRAIISSGGATGVFVPCDVKLVGFAILGAMNWVPKWFSAMGPHSGKHIADVLSTFLVRGLQNEPAASLKAPGTRAASTKRKS